MSTNQNTMVNGSHKSTPATTVVEKLVEFNKQAANRKKNISGERWQFLTAVLGQAASYADDDSKCVKLLQKPLTDTFRIMRNACTEVPGNEVSLISQPLLVQSAVKLVRRFVDLHAETSANGATVVAVRCGVQMLGNLVSCSDQTKELVWKFMFEDKPSLFSALLADDDEKVRLYSSMLLYNCLLRQEACHAFLADVGSSAVIARLTDMLAQADSEWSLFTLGLFVQHELFQHVFRVLDQRSRYVILDVILDKLDEGKAENEGRALSSSLLDFLCDFFRAQVMDIVKMAEPTKAHDGLDPVEVTKVLDLLCAASVHPTYSSSLKEKESLLEISVDILKTVHFLGKAEENVFSPVQHLDDLAQVQDGTSDLAEHPVFGFKRKLVRLIGNLCHGSRRNQDMVRNMEGVALILDVCNLDARNPYIIQWAVLAVRNLLENNLENQAVVAGLVRRGVVPDNPLLQEMRIQLDR